MVYNNKIPIREFSGRIIGWLESDNFGNQRISAFSGKILGTYEVNSNITRNFIGKIISKGNTLTALLYSDALQN